MSSGVIWCHPMSSDDIRCHLSSSVVICCHLSSSVVIWCHYCKILLFLNFLVPQLNSINLTQLVVVVVEELELLKTDEYDVSFNTQEKNINGPSTRIQGSILANYQKWTTKLTKVLLLIVRWFQICIILPEIDHQDSRM